ncbi:hypothetical protein V474_24030 [Novosphingobium barchaimii LL02]|uniref:DUF4350 domain-containing protein n=1 Tax=Novosphingobium barchaimii LL02 TaxID=1114963 RepID=A0A0J8ABU4_9SPHN|nr:DUF4350 domain-containing protein [Novosphingobium barchaimii]KMS52625.1 hypothetical protein V474_24030 [Novosphingobium barchaimii LL02]
MSTARDTSTAGRTPTGIAVGANPFSRWAVLALVLLGGALFVALLWMIATGTGMGSANDGQAHAEGRGLNGYAAFADYIERRGYAVSRVRNQGALNKPGLLVLTPPAFADGKDIEKIVANRRYIGPTLVIAPKWMASQPAREQKKDAKTGWVRLTGTMPPEWRGFLDTLSVRISPLPKTRAAWQGAGLSGVLPDGRYVLSGGGTGLVRIVGSRDGKLTLAGFMDDGGYYPELEDIAQDRVINDEEDEERYPVIIVFEPDLLDNYGMARMENARLAEALVRASGVEKGAPVSFDMTLPGYSRSQNLLTLAFTPPFLAATLCLLLAALVVGWRGFMRFGPPLVQGRAIAFGKRALVSNAAGFVRRTRRWHLLGGPYADHSRERLVQALALPRTLGPERADAAIDRALAARRHQGEPFSVIAGRLRAARRPHDLLKAARDLHALERMLIR